MLDCRPYVDYSQRLFRHALRIIGWGHSWGNVMSSVCKACPKWTQVLESMRCLVSFFRNKTWRKHVKKSLAVIRRLTHTALTISVPPPQNGGTKQLCSACKYFCRFAQCVESCSVNTSPMPRTSVS